jgi:ATP-dependent Clp protease ATP-binding subunit ClpA
MNFLDAYPLSSASGTLFERAANEASSRGHRYISDIHVMIALCQEPAIREALTKAGVNAAQYADDLAYIISDARYPSRTEILGLKESCARFLERAAERIGRKNKDQIDPIDLFLVAIADRHAVPTLVLQHRGHNVRFLYDISLVVAVPA